MSHPGAGPPADPNDDDGCDPRRGGPRPDPVRIDPLVRLGLVPELEQEPGKSFVQQVTDFASDAKRLVITAVDTATDVLRKEGALSSPSSKLQRARSRQQQELQRHLSPRKLQQDRREERRPEPVHKREKSRLEPLAQQMGGHPFFGLLNYLWNFWRLLQVRILLGLQPSVGPRAGFGVWDGRV